MHPSYTFIFIPHVSPSFCRYIRDTNIKNSAEDLNALINKLRPDTVTWTPQPGSVLDLGLALRDPTNRLTPQNTVCLPPPINEQTNKHTHCWNCENKSTNIISYFWSCMHASVRHAVSEVQRLVLLISVWYQIWGETLILKLLKFLIFDGDVNEFGFKCASFFHWTDAVISQLLSTVCSASEDNASFISDGKSEKDGKF